MNTLELRKKLILAESELLRQHLKSDWNSFHSSWQGGTGQTRKLVMGAVVGWSLLKILRRGSGPRERHSNSKLGMLIQVLLLAWPAWTKMRTEVGKRR